MNFLSFIYLFEFIKIYQVLESRVKLTSANGEQVYGKYVGEMDM